MPRFEYRILDLNALARGQTLLEVLNAAGADGWELISVSAINSGIFKRPIPDRPVEMPLVDRRYERESAGTAGDREKLRQGIEAIARERGLSLGEILDSDLVKSPVPDTVKFQDPLNPENTWSGRGRMPKWLSEAIAKGTSKEDYRVRSKQED